MLALPIAEAGAAAEAAGAALAAKLARGEVLDPVDLAGSIGLLLAATETVGAADTGQAARVDAVSQADEVDALLDRAEARAIVDSSTPEATPAADAIAVAGVLLALAEAVAASDVATTALIRQRILELLARLAGPLVLSGRLAGPRVLAGRLAVPDVVTLPGRIGGARVLLGGLGGPVILKARLAGMTIMHPVFEVTLGDGYLLRFPVDLAPGVPADLAGASAEFGYVLTPDPAARENAGRPSAGISFGAIVLEGVAYPTVEVALPKGETAGLKPRTLYHYACRVTLSGAEPETVARGTWRTAPAPL